MLRLFICSLGNGPAENRVAVTNIKTSMTSGKSTEHWILAFGLSMIQIEIAVSRRDSVILIIQSECKTQITTITWANVFFTLCFLPSFICLLLSDGATDDTACGKQSLGSPKIIHSIVRHRCTDACIDCCAFCVHCLHNFDHNETHYSVFYRMRAILYHNCASTQT